MRKNLSETTVRPRTPGKKVGTGGAGQPLVKTPVTGGTGKPTPQGFRAGPAIIPPVRTPVAKRTTSRMNALSRKK